MKKIILVCSLLFVSIARGGEDSHALRGEFAPLQFLVGACWLGDFPGGKQKDVHCYEPVFNGVHLRDRHAVSGGPELYRGETIYSWNQSSQKIEYVYWNSLGGVSTGSATPENGKINFPDESYLGADGQEIVISTVWENMSDQGYDSVSIETYPDGKTRERRVRYRKTGFSVDPVDEL